MVDVEGGDAAIVEFKFSRASMKFGLKDRQERLWPSTPDSFAKTLVFDYRDSRLLAWDGPLPFDPGHHATDPAVPLLYTLHKGIARLPHAQRYPLLPQLDIGCVPVGSSKLSRTRSSNASFFDCGQIPQPVEVFGVDRRLEFNFSLK